MNVSPLLTVFILTFRSRWSATLNPTALIRKNLLTIFRSRLRLVHQVAINQFSPWNGGGYPLGGRNGKCPRDVRELVGGLGIVWRTYALLQELDCDALSVTHLHSRQNYTEIISLRYNSKLIIF